MQAAIFAMVRETLKKQRRVIMYVIMWSVDSFYLGMHEFFWHFTVTKRSLSLPAERLSCLCVRWFVYVDTTCKEGLWEKCVLASKFLMYCRSINGSEALFNLSLPEK